MAKLTVQLVSVGVYHLNLSVCKDVKLRERIVSCLSALTRDWMSCASYYKKHIHLTGIGSKYDFLYWCFQQANHIMDN